MNSVDEAFGGGEGIWHDLTHLGMALDQNFVEASKPSFALETL